MSIDTEERLRKKGWSEDEIRRAFSVMSEAKKKTKSSLLFSETFKTIVFWGGLIIAVIINFIAAAFFIPLLLTLSKTFLYVLISILGLCFGLMFQVLITDLERVDEKHHIIGGIFIPTLAAITVYVMVDLSNSFNKILRLRASEIGGVFELHNPIYISIFYVSFFVLPYAIHKIKYLKLKKNKKKPEEPQQPQMKIIQESQQILQQPIQQPNYGNYQHNFPSNHL
jgi:large-conductance mechanosensitive channel